MAMIEGGPFRCDIENFETRNIEEWNDHCLNHDVHTETGSTLCTVCGTIVEFESLPFHKLDAGGSKNIQLKCEDCETKTTGNVKRKVAAKQK